MNPKQVGAFRRAGIYFVVGYAGLAVINNSDIAPNNMWVAYLPLFIGVYFFARWADAKIAAFNSAKRQGESTKQ
jgi:hypothetical protein